MRKKDYWIFAAIVFGLIIAGGIPRLLIAFGIASDQLSAYTADENGVLYIATNRQIHIINREGQEIQIIAPFTPSSIHSIDEQTLLLTKEYRCVYMCKDGTIMSTDNYDKDNNYVSNTARPLSIGNTVYNVRMLFGRYYITEKTHNDKKIRYQMPLMHYGVLLYEILFFISFFPIAAILPIYYYKAGRIAKNGMILPPQGSRQA